MQAVADYAADVLGTDVVSKLERSGNIDRFRVAKDLLLVGVAGVMPRNSRSRGRRAWYFSSTRLRMSMNLGFVK
jgi:hypothetical protein